MKTSTAIIFVLLFAFAAIANAQTNSTTNSTSGADDNPVAKCIQQKNCGSDMSCIAKCAGVPDPSPKDANDTNACVSKCNQSDPTPTYVACVNNCINTIYQPTGDSGSSGNSPSGSASPSGSSSGTKSGSSPTGSSSATPSGNSTKSAAQSLDSRIAFSNSLSMMATLLLVCVVARMTNVGF